MNGIRPCYCLSLTHSTVRMIHWLRRMTELLLILAPLTKPHTFGVQWSFLALTLSHVSFDSPAHLSELRLVFVKVYEAALRIADSEFNEVFSVLTIRSARLCPITAGLLVTHAFK